MSETFDVQYVRGSQITCLESILIKSCYHLETRYEMFVCVCVFHYIQSESAAGAHFNTRIIFRRQNELLIFINNCTSGHKVSVGRVHVKRKHSCGLFNLTVWVYSVFLIWTWFFLPGCDSCKALKSPPWGMYLSRDSWGLGSDTFAFVKIAKQGYYIMDTIIRYAFLINHNRCVVFLECL